jgi:hypothetical protein
MTTSMTETSGPIRLLGAAGILGGVALLAVFIIGIPGDVNPLRLVVYNLGAIAVAIATLRHRTPFESRLTLGVAAAVVLTNAWYLAMVVLGVGRPVSPLPDPEFRLVMFYAGLAMWLADSAFGFMALRIGHLTKWGALALAVGSLLAIVGMSHLGLTSPTDPTIFALIPQVGLVLNGVGWIVLGGDLVLGDRDGPAG